MSDEPSQPDWSLLPHNPQRFFDLDSGFDRKTLKRSYNRLIRAFKPETHPAEFQKIRAAYEQLDQVLRYGGGMGDFGGLGAENPDAAWLSASHHQPAEEQHAAGEASAARPGPAPVEAPKSLEERLAEESPADLYAELRDAPSKSPYDYYCLAVMSDVVDRRDGLQFARWLLEGIRRHPDDYALPRLLQAYFRGPVAEESLPKLLLAAAKAIGRDAFFPITEPGWEGLLRNQSLDRFVETLRKCEAELRDISIAGKMAFTIRTLRMAYWKAETASPTAAAWVDEAMEFIEGNFEQIPPELEFEVDLLGILQEYIARRRSFADAGDLRNRLDKALEAYFTSDQVLGDRAVVERQLEMASDVEGLLTAFPADDEYESTSAFYQLWQWVSYEVGERCGAEEEEVDYNLWSGRTLALLRQLEAKSDASGLGQVWNWSGVALLGARLIIYFGSLILVFALTLATCVVLFRHDASSLSSLEFLLAIALSVPSCVFGGQWCDSQLTERLYSPFCERMALKCYKKLWRRDALGLLGRSRMPFHVFRELLARQASNEISTSIWVSNHAGQDYALALYALAQRHVV